MRNQFSGLRKYNIYNMRFSLVLGLLGALIFTTAFAQETDYFGDLINNSDAVDENVFELETEEANEPQDLVTVTPIRLKAVGTLTADIIKSSLRSAKVVNPKTFQNGASIPRGTVLQFDMQYKRINGISLNRKILLWSKLHNPEQFSDEDGLKWKKSPHKSWVTYVNVTKKSSFTYKNIADNMRIYNGYLQIYTGNLKPGAYHFGIETYRKENGQTIEKDIERFNFTVIDAPLHLVAEIPKSIPTYNPDRNVWAGEYEAFLSDWAVLPMKVEIITYVPGFAIRDGEELYETVVEFQLRPKKKHIGQTKRFTLKVTDRLGRTASLTRDVYITDSSDSEMKVVMANSANAGETITGTVIYPSGFVLKKKPRTNVRTGFAWTNSSYTAFRVKVKEEGVNYKKLFAIIATGNMSGIDEEQVLTWKRTYNVKSRDLIYDPEAIRRKKEASDRAWREAFSTLATVAGASASAYESSGAENTDGFWYDDDDGKNWDEENNSNYEVISTEWSDDDDNSGSPNYDGLEIDNTANSRTSSDGKAGTICGYKIGGEYAITDVGAAKYFHLNGKKYLSYQIWRNDGTGSDLIYYKKDCVLAQEKYGGTGKWETFKYYPNGGKAESYTRRYHKKWDYLGNLTYHAKIIPDWSADKKIICDNEQSKYPKCS